MNRPPRPTTTKSASPTRASKKPVASTPSSRPTTDIEKLSEQLKALRLPIFREQHPLVAEQAAREGWTHLQFLAELTSKEC